MSELETPPNGPVCTETTTPNDRPVTIVRDANGNIIYPSYVPPATKPPPTSGPQQRPSDAGPSRHHHPDRPSPAVGKQWTAELPSQSQSQSQSQSIPVMHRAGTNAPGMERPFQDAEGEGDDSSSSSESSSSEEDEEDDGQGRKFGIIRKKKPKKKEKENAKENGRKKKSKHTSENDRFRRFHVANEHYRTKGKVSKRDGRLSISLHDTSNTGYLAKALGTAARKMAPLTKPIDEAKKKPEPRSRRSSTSTAAPPPPEAEPEEPPCPSLNIVIMVIGSRGDAQPFLKIAKLLHEKHGHRVRIATHPSFRSFVSDDCGPGVEFFSVGGDPSELMAFMVKNPGMIPTLSSVKAGDVGRRRAAMADMFEGFWRACINSADDEGDPRNLRLMGSGGRDPFVADAIIANPPSFAHIHCAEALGIPLHLMFTFPYTPTQAFPHPLARIKRSNVDPGYTNFMSYPLVEMMVWQGLGDLVNDFREKTLGLDPVSTLWAPGATYRQHVPFTYLWSPGLVPKPPDWGPEVDIAGFVFLDLASSFKPPDPLTKFLESSDEPPIYIGFGSIVVDDPDRFTSMIFEAVKMAGVRALVSKGWGGLGGDSVDVPDEVFLLDNTPHDWLFPRVRACVIHGGAGTTAITLKCGKPVMIVPFFGDQHFWGTMVESAGAGPSPVPYKNLTAEKLADGIRYCITDDARKAAEEIARDIELEGDGAENACRAFHKGLVLKGKKSMRCSILPDRVAVWQMRDTGLRLSAVAAEMLVEKGLLSWKKLRLLRHNEWNDFEGPGEPVTGVAGSLMSSVGDVFGGIGGVPYRVAKNTKKRRKREKEREKERQKKTEKGDDGSEGDGSSNETDIPHVETTTTHAIHRRRTSTSTAAASPAKDVVRQVGRGAKKTATALVRTPVDLSIALTQGFHNAPRLYGDDTVRRPTRVTGFRSGLRAARHEFVYGIYDGWTGVVRLPYRGARDEGVRGFVSGVGMGLTGFVLKDIAALIGPVGYTLKGVVKQAERGRQPVKYIRRARMVEGDKQLHALDEAEQKEREEEVVAGWKLMRQLWAEMKRSEQRKQRGLMGGFGASAARRLRKGGDWNAVFENVDVAQRALDALKSGDGLEAVLGEGNEVGKLRSGSATEATTNGKSSSGLTSKKSCEPGSMHDPGVDDAAPGPETGAMEEENPFSTGTAAITENKAQNSQAVAALDIKAS